MPAFAFNSFLKMTSVEIELLTDITMYKMIEGNLRGGVSYVANRSEEATNQAIMYLDVSLGMHSFQVFNYFYPEKQSVWRSTIHVSSSLEELLLAQ